MDHPLSAAHPVASRPVLRVGMPPGVAPDKWCRRWAERRPHVPVEVGLRDDATRALARRPGDDGVDLAFVREWDDEPRSAPAGLLRIPLYTEQMAVLAPRDHEIWAVERVAAAELFGERRVAEPDPVTCTAESARAAVELVAAGVGLLELPLPWARQLARRDVVVRELDGVRATRIGIAWAPEREGEEVLDAFVGVVRGRTARSSRDERPAAERPRDDGRRTERRRDDPGGRPGRDRRGGPTGGPAGRRRRR